MTFSSRRARVIQITLALGWALVFALICRLPRRWPLRLGAHARARMLVGGVAFAAVPFLFATVRTAPRGEQASGVAPNIVLITFDAIRADRLSLYGGQVPVPQFEALAREGVVFERCLRPGSDHRSVHAQCSVRVSPASSPPGACASATYAIPKAGPSLAETLQERGYATYAVVANYSLNHETGILRGFSKQMLLHHIARHRNIFSLVLPGAEAVVQLVVRRPLRACLLDTSRLVLRHAQAIVGRRSERPFFLWLHFMDPHDPYAPPERYRAGSVCHEGRWPIIAPHDPDLGTPTFLAARSGHVLLSAEDRGYISDLYDAEIAYADDLLGQVRNAVQHAGTGRQVVWCVTADHGEEFWDHGDWGHGHSLYEELVHVPLLIAGPTSSGATRVADPVGLVDVMPTLWDLSGLTAPAGYRGKSLRPLMAGERPDNPVPVFSERNPQYQPLESVVVGDMKLIRDLDTRIPRLFDLRADPQERRNLAEQETELTNRLALVLDQWRLGLLPVGAPAPFEKQREQLGRLKALGYL